VKSAIGIDPDSTGFVCALVKSGKAQVSTKRFSVTVEALGKFLQWVKSEGKPIVAIEGSHGQSRPIEKALREAGVIFHSFKPADTDKFRKAVLGQNKNNERDAESVARYALALDAQSKLEQYRRVWCADMELQASHPQVRQPHRSTDRGSQPVVEAVALRLPGSVSGLGGHE
jgi:transposase